MKDLKIHKTTKEEQEILDGIPKHHSCFPCSYAMNIFTLERELKELKEKIQKDTVNKVNYPYETPSQR